MDNEQLLDRVQSLLIGMEERVGARFDLVDIRFDKVESRLEKVEVRLEKVEIRLDKVESRLDHMDIRLSGVETKLESMTRELALNNELLGPFIRWSHRVEDEVIRLAAQLQELQARLTKLEGPSRQ